MRLCSLWCVASLLILQAHWASADGDSNPSNFSLSETMELLRNTVETYTIFNDGSLVVVGENHYWSAPSDEDFIPDYKRAYDSLLSLSKRGKIILATEGGIVDSDGLWLGHRLEGADSVPSGLQSLGSSYLNFSTNPVKFLDEESSDEELQKSRKALFDDIFYYLFALRRNMRIGETAKRLRGPFSSLLEIESDDEYHDAAFNLSNSIVGQPQSTLRFFLEGMRSSTKTHLKLSL